MFQKATKKKQKARVALIGPAGSGKTYSALEIGKHLGDRIAVIDTERGSASKYSGDVADFDVVELGRYAPAEYLKAINAARDGGYDVLVIDSLSHAWEGDGGILDQVDKRGGRFDVWKDMSPQTRSLIDAILTYPGHVITTMRTKTEWVVEEKDRGGRTVKEPRKIGLAPKFKEGLEYEFDLVGNMDDASLSVSKSRCAALHDAHIKHPGKQFATALRAWLEDGVDAPAPAAKVEAAPQKRRLGDIQDADELLAWCRAESETISRRTGNAREQARRLIAQAAERCGVDEREAFAACGMMKDEEVAA